VPFALAVAWSKHIHTEVAAIRHDAGRIRGIELADGLKVDGYAVIIAAGA